MLDIWGFFIQTLSVSGVSLLILFIKSLFKDKLSPKWQLTVWGVLGIMILIPTGMLGDYTLFRWQIPMEIIKSWFGIYSYTKVWFPFPLIVSFPITVADWIFTIYAIGVVVFLLKYLISYFGLKHFIKSGSIASDEISDRIKDMAAEHGIKIYKIIEIRELPSAFVCGIIRPVLVIPSGKRIDEKIILHELFHIKNKDTLISIIICILRCLHWCNPLIWYCSIRALNDIESRCDQYVLESIEGEQRREYGHILLSMVNDRFSKTPGCTCINNGGRNIRDRIENIARFKKYPKGMRLVSVCIIILLILPLTFGSQASSLIEFNDSVELTLASARCTPCTTPAGAFDAYGRAVIDRNGYYRAMCAPENIQEAILTEMLKKDEAGISPTWDPGLSEWADKQSGYYIYNLKRISEIAYEGLLVIKLNYPPYGKAEEINKMYLAIQNLRVEKENGRWVTIPLDEFQCIETLSQSLAWGCTGLPGIVYSGESNNFIVEISYQTIHTVNTSDASNNDFIFGQGSSYDFSPRPNTEFTNAARSQYIMCYYIGEENNKDNITHIGISVAPVYEGEERPSKLKDPYVELSKPIGDMVIGSSNSGEQWGSIGLSPGWNSEITMNGGGGSVDPTKEIIDPTYYALDFYINKEKVAELSLYGGKSNE